MRLKDNDDLETRTIKNFADILILKYLKTHPPSSGYEILRYLLDEFNISFSPGTVYHAIYLLERKNLIKCNGDENGRICRLTEKGEKALTSTANSSSQIQVLVSSILSGA